MKKGVHLGIASRNEIVREGLRRILSEQGLVVDLVASTGAELEQAAVTQLIVIDAMEFANGLGCCEEIRVRRPRARIALMVDECDPTSVAKAFQTGPVDGYLIKDSGCESLARSLLLIAMGEKLFPSQLANYQSEVPPSQWNGKYQHFGLSSRELEILSCLVDGDANKVIARRLQIAEATVKVHVKAILRKMGVKNRTQAAIQAVSRGGGYRETSTQTRCSETPPRGARLMNEGQVSGAKSEPSKLGCVSACRHG